MDEMDQTQPDVSEPKAKSARSKPKPKAEPKATPEVRCPVCNGRLIDGFCRRDGYQQH